MCGQVRNAGPGRGLDSGARIGGDHVPDHGDCLVYVVAIAESERDDAAAHPLAGEIDDGVGDRLAVGNEDALVVERLDLGEEQVEIGDLPVKAVDLDEKIGRASCRERVCQYV